MESVSFLPEVYRNKSAYWKHLERISTCVLGLLRLLPRRSVLNSKGVLAAGITSTESPGEKKANNRIIIVIIIIVPDHFLYVRH